jgi:hypothetical protein
MVTRSTLVLSEARRIREAVNAFSAYTRDRVEADEPGNAEVMALLVFNSCLPSMARSPQGAGIRSIAAASAELYHAAILLTAGMHHGLFLGFARTLANCRALCQHVSLKGLNPLSPEL